MSTLFRINTVVMQPFVPFFSPHTHGPHGPVCRNGFLFPSQAQYVDLGINHPKGTDLDFD